jgi:hypothetical protein
MERRGMGEAKAADQQVREPDRFEDLPHPPGALAGQAAVPFKLYISL